MIHLPAARMAEHGELLLECSHREPGLTSRRILRGLEHRHAVKDQEAARLKQQTNQKRIAFVQMDETFEIGATCVRQARMVQNVVEAQPQPAADKALKLVSFHRYPSAQ